MKRNVKSPPKLAQRLLLSFLRRELAEEVLGDLEEKFYQTVAKKSGVVAQINYWFQVIHYLRPFAIQRLRRQPNRYAMFQSYFKISWRNLIRQKTYSFIKLGGFAVGIAACLLIALYVKHELSYDLHYVNQDRIYRVLRFSTFRNMPGVGVHFPAPFTEALQTDYPEFEKVGHYHAVEWLGSGGNEVRRTDRAESSHEERIAFVDQSLIEILEVPFISGDPAHALTEPNTLIITKEKAEKYFKGEDPLGQVLILNNDENRQYTVTGVVENFPTNSHLQYDFMITLAGKEFWEGEQTNWRASNYINYVKLPADVDVASLERKLLKSVEKYFLPAAVEAGGNSDEINWLKNFRFALQPVHEIYLNRVGVRDSLPHGEIRYLWLFASIAVFILLIACVNFINLSTAKSANRAREVGLRKVVGSTRYGLVNQFLTESLLYSLISFTMGLLLAGLFLRYFNVLVGKPLSIPWSEWWFVPGILAGALIVGLISGIYPSMYLSSFKPVRVLRGNISRGSKNAATRGILVVFQFTVSIVLIVGTIVIHRQMNFILTKDLGFDKEQVMLIQSTHTLGDKINTFKNELLRLPQVQHVSVTGFLPVDGFRRNGGHMWTDEIRDQDGPGSQHWAVDHDYIKTMGLKIAVGRDFLPTLASDSQAIIINKTMAKALQLTQPIGQQLINWKGRWTVIGVVDDFHFQSLREEIQPIAMYLDKSYNTVAVKLRQEDIPEAVQSITGVWKQFSPNQTIRYTFLDQEYARMYDDIDRTGKIFTGFAVLAILVACLGLYALSSFMVEQRSKEISIRLVLGASLQNIFRLLTGNFIKLIGVAFAIGAPLAWLMMQQWLRDYQYKTEITADIFFYAAALSMNIAVLTISYQAVAAALRNPAVGLRTE